MDIIDQILRGVKTVAISGHIHPDGDCIGACLGLYNYMIEYYPELEVSVYLKPIISKFYYLNHVEDVSSSIEKNIQYDLFIILDTSDLKRLGEFGKYFDLAKKTVCIDHHVTNHGFAQTNYIRPDVSSTCEVLFYLMEEARISKSTAECLYTGIIHDTGIFKYANTTENTMYAAGKLISKGIDFNKIIDDSFYRKTYIQNQILGRALLESMTFLHGKCIVSGIRAKDMEFYQVTNKDLDGIIEQLRVTEGVECAIFCYEIGIHEYKVSMRSNSYVDVSQIAAYFGGGGHIRAAGCTMNGSFHDVINNLSLQIERQIVLRDSK